MHSASPTALFLLPLLGSGAAPPFLKYWPAVIFQDDVSFSFANAIHKQTCLVPSQRDRTFVKMWKALLYVHYTAT